NLRVAAFDPEIELLLLPQHALVQQADALVAEAHRQRANPLVPAPRLAAWGDHRLLGADAIVEIIQDHRALNQRLAAVKHQRRHPPQRVIRRDLVGVAEGRPRLVLEGDAIEPHRDGDAADGGPDCNGLSSPAKAEYPIRCGLAVLSPLVLEYWITRRSLSSGGAARR